MDDRGFHQVDWSLSSIVSLYVESVSPDTLHIYKKNSFCMNQQPIPLSLLCLLCNLVLDLLAQFHYGRTEKEKERVMLTKKELM